jgi:hypothetical protein
MSMSGITDHRAELHGVWCAADNKYTFDIGKHGDIAGNIIVTPAIEAGMRVVLNVAGTPLWTYSSSSQVSIPVTLNMLRIGEHSKCVIAYCDEGAQPTVHVTYRCYDDISKRRRLALIAVNSMMDYLCDWD